MRRFYKRSYFALDYAFLRLHGIFFQTGPHIFEIQLQHGGEGHVAALGALAKKLLLEGIGVLLAGEAALLFELALALP
ncbi:hypothetical protein NE463_20025, partial [Anaerotruncus colihominis]